MKHRFLIPLLLWLAFLNSCNTFYAQFIIDEKDLIGFDYTELTLEFGGYNNRLSLLKLEIQGTIFRLMLDTGSEWGTLTLTPQAVNKLNVSYTGREQRHTDLHGNIYHAKEFIIPSLMLGKLRISKLPAYTNLTSPAGFDGCIGLGLLKNFNILIDYHRRKLVLYKRFLIPDFLVKDKWFQYHYRDHGQFLVNFVFSDKAYLMGLDTGSNSTLIALDSQLARDLRSSSISSEAQVVINQRTGKPIKLYNIDLHLGKYDLGNHTCILIEMASYMGNGIMGYDFFRNNAVFIDFQSKAVWLKSNGINSP